MSWLPDERYEAEFAAQTARLGEAVLVLAPDDRIPTCPEWTVRDLVGHVGAGHRWCSTMIEARATVPLVPIPEAPAPQAQDEWPGWLAEGAQRLTDAVRDAGHRTEVWTWQEDRTAGFWLRRMLHDELIHRYDAEHAAGRPCDGVAPDLAADGVSDFLDTAATLSRSSTVDWGFRGLRGSGETMRLETPSGAWFVRRTPEGAQWTRDDGPADVVAVGPAWDLLLVLNRRLEPGSVTVTGDEVLFTHWWENSKF
jgi:uncharacterized protein (TIGR03083 family)